MRRTAPVAMATVGENLAIDCSYVASMDAPHGEPVTLQAWRTVIERDDQPVQRVAGSTRIVSMNGSSVPGIVVERWQPSSPGHYRFRCRLDAGNSIAETDEDNNELELELALEVSAVPARRPTGRQQRTHVPGRADGTDGVLKSIDCGGGGACMAYCF